MGQNPQGPIVRSGPRLLLDESFTTITLGHPYFGSSLRRYVRIGKEVMAFRYGEFEYLEAVALGVQERIADSRSSLCVFFLPVLR